MHREEWEREETCGSCGAAISPDSERGYAFGLSGLLCWTCAIRRGGRYDAELERWVGPPDVSDLPDEEYGASPHERRR
jgi:hypothetical protein